MRVGDDCIRTVSAQKLRCEYEVLDFHDGKGVEDFAMRLSGIVNQLAVLGDPEPDDKVILKLLRIVLPRYKQLIISIETLLDVSTLSLEEVTGRLRSAEEDCCATNCRRKTSSDRGRMAREEQGVGDGSRGGYNGSRGGRGHGGGIRGRGRGRGGCGDGAGSPGGRGGNNNNCHRCGKPGHWARECRSKQPKKEEQAYAAQEESSLLLAEVKTGGGDLVVAGDSGHVAGEATVPVAIGLPQGIPLSNCVQASPVSAHPRGRRL
jgi:hypothetical protein